MFDILKIRILFFKIFLVDFSEISLFFEQLHNGFLRSLNVKKNLSFPLTLTASLTRPLNKDEFEDIASPNEWGVLPIRPMGATVRMTKDKEF